VCASWASFGLGPWCSNGLEWAESREGAGLLEENVLLFPKVINGAEFPYFITKYLSLIKM
jgi:hypothetical protein